MHEQRNGAEPDEPDPWNVGWIEVGLVLGMTGKRENGVDGSGF